MDLLDMCTREDRCRSGLARCRARGFQLERGCRIPPRFRAVGRNIIGGLDLFLRMELDRCLLHRSLWGMRALQDIFRLLSSRNLSRL